VGGFLTQCIFQIALRKLGENRKSAAEVLKDSIEKEKSDALFTHFNEFMDNWLTEPVKLAVTGKSRVGKSAFINAIRNLKSGDPGFANTSSFGNTTKHATVFEYPGNPKITLHDLPGFGTTNIPTKQYKEEMELHKYDYVLIFIRHIEENDMYIARKLKEINKPFCFVRSKYDLDIEYAKNDGEPEAEAIEKLKSKSLDILRQEGFKEVNFYVISNRSRRIGDFNDLVLYIQSNLPKMKCDVDMYPLMREFTDDINSIYKKFKDRIWDISLASAGPAATPVPGLDVVLDLALICKEIWLYHNAFGFGQQIVKDISKHDYLRKKLSASSIIEIEAANEAMEGFVIIQLGKLQTLMAVQNTLGVIPPFIGPVVSGSTAGKVTHNLLTRILDGCRDDAKLVYSHLMKVNAEVSFS
jgi:GTP-binding protein EngB required for normal cell division